MCKCTFKILCCNKTAKRISKQNEILKFKRFCFIFCLERKALLIFK
uniref:Uncharacterized protein n=1 Tax=Anguilla anguilla TaxID=7936 RepID=A0A0E9VWN6_ANGAN